MYQSLLLHSKQNNLTTPRRIERWRVGDEPELSQIFNALMIRRQAIYFGILHNQDPGYIDWILKAIEIVKLEECHIQADMSWSNPITFPYCQIKPCQLLHFFHYYITSLFNNFAISSYL